MNSLSNIMNSKALSPVYETFEQTRRHPKFHMGISVSATLILSILTIYALFSRNVKKPVDENVRVGGYNGVLLGTTCQAKSEKRYVFNEFLTPEECEYLLVYIALNLRKFQPALVLSPDGTIKVGSSRNAQNLSLISNANNEKWATAEIGLIIQKICILAGHILKKTPDSIKDLLEDCIITRYEKGEGYIKPHHDDAVPKQRFRELTMIIYLNKVGDGGETHFVRDERSIVPEEGKLLCFNNHPEDAPEVSCCQHEGRIPKSKHKFILAATIMSECIRDINALPVKRNAENPYPLPPLPNCSV